jgi:hypothetical protein
MTQFLHQKIPDIQDDAILRLIEELKIVTNLPESDFETCSLFHFLTQCLYPDGDPRPVPIRKDAINSMPPVTVERPLLLTKVKSQIGTSIYDLCGEIARHFGQGVEPYEGKSLYMFLNHFYKPSRNGSQKMPKKLSTYLNRKKVNKRDFIAWQVGR